MKSPFKFLGAFEENDKNVFFGREKEVAQLYQLVKKTPLVLLYGFSGTGKTSVVQCGLTNCFDGPDWLPVWVRRQDDINIALTSAIDHLLPEEDRKGDIIDKIRLLYSLYLRPVYLIFDQFEEIMVLGKAQPEEKKDFAKTLKKLVQPGIPCTAILILREEYIGALYWLEREIPTLFDYRLRIEAMNSGKVGEVLEKSFKAFNIEVEAPKEDSYNLIIQNVSRSSSSVELPFLQVYLDLFYREDYVREEKAAPLVFNEKGLPALNFSREEIGLFGTIDVVLEKFLAEQKRTIQQKLKIGFPQAPDDLAGQILNAFVSEDGTKKPVRYELKDGILKPDAEFAKPWPQLPEGVLSQCLYDLEAVRLLRIDAQSIELWHDSLAAVIDRQRTDVERRRNEVKRNLDNAYLEWHNKTGDFLSDKQLTAYVDYVPELNLDPKVRFFIDESITKRANMRKNRNILRFSLMILPFILLAIGWLVYDSSQKEKIANLVAQARSEAYTDPTMALKTLQKAIQTDPDHPAVLGTLADIYSNNEFYEQIFQHHEPVKGVVFVPDSTGDLLSWTESAVYRWNQNGAITDSLPVSGLSAAVLSPDGKRLIAGTQEGNLILLNVNNLKQERQTVGIPATMISHLVFDANGRTLFVAGNSQLITLDINDLSKPVHSFDFKKMISGMAFLPVSDLLLLGFENGDAEEWTPALKRIKTLARHKDQVLSFAVSPIGDAMVSADRDATLYFRDPNGNLLYSLKGHERRINSVVWSPDSSRIFSASMDMLIKSWSPDGNLIATYKGHTGFVNTVVCSTDGQYIASAGDDKTVCLWKVESKVRQRFGPHQNGVSGIAMTSDGKQVFTASDAGLSDAGEKMNNLDFDFGTFLDAMFNSKPRSAFLWDAGQNQKPVEFKGHKGGINAVAVFGESWVTASDDSTVTVWNKLGQPTKPFVKGHHGKVLAVTFSPDGRYILTAGDDKMAILWSNQLELLDTITHPGLVRTVAFSPDGAHFMTGCYDGGARLFDLKGNLVRTYWGVDSLRVETLVFSPDGKSVLIGYWNNKACLYELSTGKQIFEIKIYATNKTGGNAIRSVAFSPDGKSICLGAEGGFAQVYRIIDGQAVPMQVLQHYPKRSVLCVAFTKDEKGVLTGSGDGWGRWWKL